MYLEEMTQLKDHPALVAVIGIGRMGRGIVDQMATMTGLQVRALADVDLERARCGFTENGWSVDQVCVTDSVDAAEDALKSSQVVVSSDPQLISSLSSIDAVVESTGVPEIGAQVAHTAIEHGKHIIMLNVEADIVVGPILAEKARRRGVIYTLAAGDQPGSIFEMVEWARTLGFEIVCAGRGTVLYPNDHHATPETYMDYALRVQMNPKMYCEFRDGTKSQLEMVAVSNVLRMPPSKRGMHEPYCPWPDLGKVFSRKQDGGILDQEGVVDMANAIGPDGEYIHQDKVFPGVFVVVTSPHPGVRSAMAALFEPGFGGTPRQEGPNWGLFRPYHLPSVETPMSVVRVIVQKRPTGDLRGGPVAELITLAKRDLHPGDKLDGGGGYAVYGLNERYEVAKEQGLLPFGFAYSGEVKRPIKQDEPLRWDDVEIDTSSFLFQLRLEQQKFFGQ